jgi:hypothetical protein
MVVASRQLCVLLLATSVFADADQKLRWLRKRRGSLVETTFEHEGTSLKYEIFVPTACALPCVSKLPVLVFLHGRGESGGFDVTNAQSLPWLLLNNASFTSSFQFIAIVPQWCTFLHLDPTPCGRPEALTPKHAKKPVSMATVHTRIPACAARRSAQC